MMIMHQNRHKIVKLQIDPLSILSLVAFIAFAAYLANEAFEILMQMLNRKRRRKRAQDYNSQFESIILQGKQFLFTTLLYLYF